ncbi:MAG TPA: type II toxin-antitoxin system prevent-host-death family antitoxin [Actinomycetota bacterium]
MRELKAKLSEYLDRAEKGQVIRVTDRGRPKVQIVPLDHRGLIEKGIAEGWIKPGGPMPPKRRPRVKSIRPSHEVLDEDRGE